MSLKTGCAYHLREDGIYHMIFYDFQKSTVDQYFRHLEHLYPTIPPDIHVRLLLDTSPARGIIPLLKYIIDKSREFEKKQPQRPPVVMAIVMEMNIFARMLDTVLRVFVRSEDRMRIFGVDALDLAIEWQNRVAPSGDA